MNRIKSEKHKGEEKSPSQIDNFMPLLIDALENTSNEDIELFIKHCGVTKELVNTAGINAPFQNKWWQKEQKSVESKRTSTAEVTEIYCRDHPNGDHEDCKECNDGKTHLGHRELEALVEKFDRRIESDKNYKFYMQDPALDNNDSDASSLTY